MPEAGDLRLRGKTYDPSDMTFRENNEVQRIIREEMFPGQDIDLNDLSLSQMVPAIAVVLVRRDNPDTDFTLDEALDLRMKDVLITEDEPDEEPAKAPPTSRGSAKKETSAASGTPA